MVWKILTHCRNLGTFLRIYDTDILPGPITIITRHPASNNMSSSVPPCPVNFSAPLYFIHISYKQQANNIIMMDCVLSLLLESATNPDKMDENSKKGCKTGSS